MAKTTTDDFDLFIGALGDKDIFTIHSLYSSVKYEFTLDEFEHAQTTNGTFITDTLNEYRLCLKTNKARVAFLNILDYQFGGGINSVENYYHYQRNVEKD